MYHLKKDTQNLLLTIIYKIILEISYVAILIVLYDYDGFILNINIMKLIISYVIVVILFFILPKSSKKPSNIFIVILFLIMIIPLLSLYALKNENSYFLIYCTISFIITNLIITSIPKIKLIKIHSNSNKLLYIVTLILSFVTYGLLYLSNGFPTLKAFNLANVYEVRSSVVYITPMLSYLVTWQASIINPFLIGINLYNKKYKKCFLIVILQLVLFAYTGHKTFLFILILLFGIYYVLIKNYDVYRIFIFGLIGIVLVSSVLAYLDINIWAFSLFVRRMLFVPAKIEFYYYDFFSKNQFMYWAGSKIGTVLNTSSPYSMKIPNLISYIYSGNPKTWMNTGYLATGYTNLGFLGMIIYSILLGYILRVVDRLSKYNNIYVTMLTLTFSMFSLSNGDLLTTLITRGLLIGILILYLYTDKTKI